MPYYVWTVLAQWPAADRALRCVAYGAVFYWITFVHELYAYNGNIKEKPALCEQQSLLATNEAHLQSMGEQSINVLNLQLF